MSDGLKPLSALAQSLKLGEYEHFKGGRVRVLGVARPSEDPTQELVVYQEIKDGNLWVRPVTMFCGSLDRDGYRGPRFKFIG